VFWTLVIAAALAARPAAPVKLAAPGLTGLNTSPEELAFYTEHLAQQLTLQGLQVTTAKQISTLLGLEKQRELLGCTDMANSCMAELASALGVDGLVTGSVGKFETSYRINVSIVAASDGRTLAAYSARAGASEEVLEALTAAAKQMAAQVMRVLRGVGPPPIDPWLGLRLRPYAWIPAAGGGVAALVGTVFALQAGGKYSEVSAWALQGAQPVAYEDMVLVAKAGKQDQLLAGLSYGVAGAGLVAAGLFFLTGDPSPRPVAWRLAPGSGGVTLSWSWP